MADKLDAQTKEILRALGEHLRSTREALDVKQGQLARDVRMDPTNYAKIERGLKNVTVETLVRIARGLGVRLVVRFAPKRKAR